MASKKTKIKLSISKKISLPLWAQKKVLNVQDKIYKTPEEKMLLAIELSRLNVEYETGGPFGAVIYNLKTNKILSIGINRVISEKLSILHGEICALIFAEDYIKQYDLGCNNQSFSLYTSSEPCAMCFDAILGSGIKQIVYGAKRSDVEKIVNFDEGARHLSRNKDAKKRGVEIIKNIERKRAREVLKLYVKNNGIVYIPKKF